MEHIRRRVWKHAQVKDSALTMLLAIADFTDSDGICRRVGISGLATMCRVSRQQILNNIEKAEQCGDLVVLRQTGRKSTYLIVSGMTDRERETGKAQLTGSEETGQVELTSKAQLTGKVGLTGSEETGQVELTSKAQPVKSTLPQSNIYIDNNSIYIQETKRSDQTDHPLVILADVFLSLSPVFKLPPHKPNYRGEQGIKHNSNCAHCVYWYDALHDILEACENDVDRASEMMRQAYEKLIRDKRTVGSPKSLANTIGALIAQRQLTAHTVNSTGDYSRFET